VTDHQTDCLHMDPTNAGVEYQNGNPDKHIRAPRHHDDVDEMKSDYESERRTSLGGRPTLENDEKEPVHAESTSYRRSYVG